MRLGTFLRFMWTVRSRKPIDLERIKGMGLLAVKVGQILALRPDLLPPERCLSSKGSTNAPTPSMQRHSRD